MPPLVVLHLAPHPDDESIAVPATLLALREERHRVVNVACSLGRPEQASRREAEVREACRRARFELVVLDPPLSISRGDDLAAAEARLTLWLEQRIDADGVELIVSPSPHDGHYGHEVIGRAARRAIERSRTRPRWWMWGLWADLPLPTLLTVFDQQRLDEALHVLAAHVGELERNDYADLVRCRGVTNRVLGAERIFGFGTRGLDAPYAEVLTEAALADGGWMAYEPRTLDASAPLEGRPSTRELSWWLDEPSFRDRVERVR
jgi:LmbE family N-acetylglucosaminyl deacetylase